MKFELSVCEKLFSFLLVVSSSEVALSGYAVHRVAARRIPEAKEVTTR